MLSIPLFALEEREDGTLCAIDELSPFAGWFADLRARAYRLWDGHSCYGMNGRLYLQRQRRLDEGWEADELPTNIINSETGQRVGFAPINGGEDLPYWEAYERYLIGLSCRRDDLPALPDGEYTLLVPGGSAYDPVDHPTLVDDLLLAYLHAPTEFAPMRSWIAKRGMKGLRWVANGPDGAVHSAIVEAAHLSPPALARAL